MSLDQLERLTRRLEAIPEAVKEAVKPALLKSGEELVDRMKALAPVESGALRDSIQMTAPGGTTPPYAMVAGEQKTANENQVIVTAGDSKTRYVRLVEFGTVHSAAQAFFFPAYRLSKARIQRRLKRAISRAVREQWEK